MQKYIFTQPLRLNTSNMNKFAEFERMFNSFDIELDHTRVDIDEIVADPYSVVAHKATQAGDNILIEDTSLDIEDADVGINIKWVLSHITDFVGRKALWTVLLGFKNNNKVYIYEGKIEGLLVEPRVQSNFGFDPVFQPKGTNKTLAEEKPDSVSARYKAIENLIQNNPIKVMDPIYTWEGKYQNE
ncbi:hypothetical protein WA158_003112 [Blastocystis sp. Blastoise]